MTRILSEKYRSKVMSAEEAAKLIKNGDTCLLYTSRCV